MSPDVLVIGGGPAGLATAASAARTGADVLLVDRDARLGGILSQCVHDGFGLELYGESLTGPEYAARLIAELDGLPVRTLLNATVLSIGTRHTHTSATLPNTPHAQAAIATSSTREADVPHEKPIALAADAPLTCHVLSPLGYQTLHPRAVVLAMGCRERSFGSLTIPGPRPAGIYSAGTAQRLINIDGLMVGRRAVVLGSGDIGLIMARRMVLEGAEVACVAERLPYPGGLARNVSQCLNDFRIPLMLRHTVVEVQATGPSSGRVTSATGGSLTSTATGRLTGVAIAEVDDSGCPLPGTRRDVECDTLLVSVGLIPENELTRMAGAEMDPATGGAMVDQRLGTSVPGVFACGNALHVHDLADWASLEAARAGAQAAQYADRPWTWPTTTSAAIPVVAPPGLRYVAPQRLLPDEPATLHFRTREPRNRVTVSAMRDDAELASCTFNYLAPSEMARLELPALPAAGGPVQVHVKTHSRGEHRDE